MARAEDPPTRKEPADEASAESPAPGPAAVQPDVEVHGVPSPNHLGNAPVPVAAAVDQAEEPVDQPLEDSPSD